MRVVHSPAIGRDLRCRAPRRRGQARTGFTLVELLITITIIGILAGISLGALNAARQTARASKTKSTIAKLDRIIMRRYEEYTTRRVPISTAGLEPALAAKLRLKALRQLMRLEMPDRSSDILRSIDVGTPIIVRARMNPTSPEVTREFLPPAFSQRHATDDPPGPSECLYLIVSSGSAEDRAQFNESEIGDIDGDGQPEFIDGWGKAIGFIRWAPGFSYDQSRNFIGASDIQSGNPDTDHDPFDTHGVDEGAFHLIPLIYSGGPDKKKDISTKTTGSSPTVLADDPYADMEIGEPKDDPASSDGELNHYDNIHNHHIEQP